MTIHDLVLDLGLNWNRPWGLCVQVWVRTYLAGSLEIPIVNPPEPEPIPSWLWPDTIVGESVLAVPRFFDQSLELVRRAGGTQVYRFAGLRRKPLVFFDGVELSGRLSWLEKEAERLEEFLAQIPGEAVRIWNQEIVETRDRIQDLELGQDRRSLLLALPYLLPIEFRLAGRRLVLLFRGQEFPTGQNPVAFALTVAPELALWVA
jgi:hypothetical protein